MNAHQEAYAAAEKRRRACTDWLKKFMQPGMSKPATKDELFAMAKKELDISRTNFDGAWILAIEERGRQDWYIGLRKRRENLQ